MFNFKQTASHYFIPSEKNNFRAKMLHIDILTAYLVFAIVLSVVATTQIGYRVLGFAVDIDSQQLLEYVNQTRSAHGLSQLTINPQLSQAAQAKAANMFSNNYWAHFGPNGETPWQFIANSGYTYSMAGENLAQGFAFSKDVVDKWMDSPSHRDNILKPEYEDMGFAIVNGQLQGEDTTLVVQLFGKRLESENNNNNNLVAQASEPEPKRVVPTEVIKPSLVPTVLINQIKSIEKNPISAAKITSLAPMNTPINITLVIFLILFTALIFDMVFAYKLRLFRVTGKNMAHLIFIAVIIISIFIMTEGRIL